jgi:hypothetical protein
VEKLFGETSFREKSFGELPWYLKNCSQVVEAILEEDKPISKYFAPSGSGTTRPAFATTTSASNVTQSAASC